MSNGRRITLWVGQDESDMHRVAFRQRLPVAVHIFSRVAAWKHAVININDLTDDAKEIGFCSNNPDTLLIPDPDFFNGNAYQDLRYELPQQRPWHERQDTIVWRGSTTGIRATFPDEDFTAPGVLPRIRMCALLKSVPLVDAKIYQCVQTEDAALQEHRLRSGGLFGDWIPMRNWIDRKYAIDIDGNANAWSNLFTRLLLGCCVIKVASQNRQWYYDRLVPWVNYIPVRHDLSDLADVISWCRDHAADCARIAAGGQQLAKYMTIGTETEDAVQRIHEQLG